MSGLELVNNEENLIEYDDVFLDINMDDVDGIDVAKTIRKSNEKIFIVVVKKWFSYYFSYGNDRMLADTMQAVLLSVLSIKKL